MLHLCSCWLSTSPPHHILFGWCLCLPTFVSFVSLLWDLAGSKEGKGSALFTSLLSVRSSSLSSEFLGMHRHHPIVIFSPVRTKVVSRFQVCLFHKEAHFVTLECRIFSLLSWGSYEPNFIFAEFGERERGASDLILLVFFTVTFDPDTQPVCVRPYWLSFSLSFYCNFVILRGDRWASDLIFLRVSDFTSIPAAKFPFSSILLM